MIDAKTFLDSIQGYNESGPQSSADKPNVIAVIDPAYTSGLPKVTFEGESTLTSRGYAVLGSYAPTPGERVLMIPVGTTYAILDSVGSPGPGADPIGVIKNYAGSSAPAGYLMCDGSAVSRTTYAQLFAVCSTSFGAGDGSTTFNLPNFMAGASDVQRFPLGGVPIGTKGGSSSHTHTAGSLSAASHSHTFGSAFVELAFNAAAGVANVFMNKKSTASWVPSIGWTNSPTPGTQSTSQSTGGVIGGSTDVSGALAVTGTTDVANLYNPWQGVSVIIKAA